MGSTLVQQSLHHSGLLLEMEEPYWFRACTEKVAADEDPGGHHVCSNEIFAPAQLRFFTDQPLRNHKDAIDSGIHRAKCSPHHIVGSRRTCVSASAAQRGKDPAVKPSCHLDAVQQPTAGR